MAGGLMQLVAYGAQDIYLTGNPQITFFKAVYRRHTNFAIESIEQTWNGKVDFGETVTTTISRNGDLVHKAYLECRATVDWVGSVNAIVANLGTAIIDSIQVDIGGQQMDKHYGHWLETWSQLTQPNPSGTNEMLRFSSFPENNHSLTGSKDKDGTDGGVEKKTVLKGFGTKYQVTSLSGGISGPVVAGGGGNKTSEIQPWWVPLQFWFCKNPGLSLPLIALQYHEVKIKLQIQSLDKLAATDTHAKGEKVLKMGSSSICLWVDYIYLDTAERRRFAETSHEYLIEQVQYIQSSDNTTAIDLHFNHPVKELIWTGIPNDVLDMLNTHHTDESYSYPYFTYNYTLYNNIELTNQTIISGAFFDGPSTPSTVINEFAANIGSKGPKFLLKLNGHDRFAARDYRYFTRTQVMQYHTGYGSIELRSLLDHGGVYLNDEDSQWLDENERAYDQVNIPTMGDCIAVYSFALKPEEHQPTGTCNFSRIDKAQLCISCGGVNKRLNIYAVNYNVLRIMSGMGGLAYSN